MYPNTRNSSGVLRHACKSIVDASEELKEVSIDKTLLAAEDYPTNHSRTTTAETTSTTRGCLCAVGRRQKKQASPRQVSFSATCQVRIGLSLESYTADEISSSWYSEKDYSRIRQRCLYIISKIEQGTSKRVCVRGLERYTPEEASERELVRLETRLAVLQKQNEEGRLGFDEAIAQSYRQAGASYCQLYAHRIALQDRAAILRRA